MDSAEHNHENDKTRPIVNYLSRRLAEPFTRKNDRADSHYVANECERKG